jgi:hypothetical protein
MINFLPIREIHENLIGEIVHLRLMVEDEAQPSLAKTSYEMEKERAPPVAELRSAYDAGLLASFLQREDADSSIFYSITKMGFSPGLERKDWQPIFPARLIMPHTG